MTKIISLFNNKGEVGKTTTTFHLGWKLAELGKKVLLVDADPQCNLTGLTLGIEEHDTLFKFYDSKQNTDIFNSLAPIFALSSETPTYRNTHLPFTKTKKENLFILAGNIRFAEMDTQLATALTSSDSIPLLKPLITSINKLIRQIADSNKIDIVIIDTSPSVSTTNNCILMSSDFFIIPTSPDFYCYQAIDSLSNFLPKWSKNLENFRGRDSDSLPENNPKMLGFISQNYRIYTPQSIKEGEDRQKKMAKAYQEWASKIKNIVSDVLVSSLKKNDMIIDEKIFENSVDYDIPYRLMGIQDFNTLIPVSQKHSKPIYELKQEDHSWAGATWERKDKNENFGVKYNIIDAGNAYTDLGKSVLKMIEF